MNERIKAIGRQAGFAFIEDGVYGQRWYSSKCGMDASEFEKFAELIIQECCDIITPYNIKDGVMFDISTNLPPIYAIKKHFGVAE